MKTACKNSVAILHRGQQFKGCAAVASTAFENLRYAATYRTDLGALEFGELTG